MHGAFHCFLRRTDPSWVIDVNKSLTIGRINKPAAAVGSFFQSKGIVLRAGEAH